MALVSITTWVLSNWKDRHPDYSIDIHIEAPDVTSNIKVGFAKMPITPDVIDTWNDVNNDAKYKVEDGDTYNDNNNNGKFDPYWIAGFSNSKPANGVHDDVWSRTIILDDGNSRIALVSLDAIGFMHDDVIDVRESIPVELNIDYTIITSTHTHESIDLMGIWGENEFNSGVNPEAMVYLKQQVLISIKNAVANIRPAKLIFAEDLSGRDSILIKDTRRPIVKATGIHVMQVLDAETDTTIGVLVKWANHPESLWSRNLQISSDFPHYVRESIENGIYSDNKLIKSGLGGVAVYINGAIGGLMAPHASLPIPDVAKDTTYVKPSFEKAKAVGEQVGLMVLEALANPDTTIEKAPISLRAKTLLLPLDNMMFRLASGIGLLNRGFPELFKTRTEIAALNLGPATFVAIPGEIYPELIFGGIVNPEGRDFKIDPIEVPNIRSMMPGKYKFIIGLANDEIGYIIPKSEWDVDKPYLYNSKRDFYGEENSLGPETAPILHREILTILNDLQE